MEHLDITLEGRVQGVNLRNQIKGIADGLDVKGYARNMRDGSVAVEAEGDAASLDKFLAAIKSSPGISEIKNIKVSKAPIQGYREFSKF